MSFYWLLFAILMVVGSLIYNVSMKVGGGDANPLMFSLIVNVCAVILNLIIVMVARYGFNIDMSNTLTARYIPYALAVGLGAVLIDVSFFLTLRYGSAIASQLFWSVGGTAAFVLTCILFFKEPVTLSKAVGIVLGLASIFLIVR